MMLTREPFYFLRHGQTDWNAERLLQGQTNLPLNVIGKNQANEAKVRLIDIPVTTICCNPLDRAWQTAMIINEALKCQLVIIDELQECNFGEAEGKRLFVDSYDELIRRAERYGGEPFEVFVDRVIAGVNQALAHPGPVLIVSHGGVFRAVQSYIHLEHNGDMPNCVPVSIKPPGAQDLDWKLEPMRH